MVSKCKHTKEDGQQTNARQYLFIALLFYSQENTNTALTASKHNASTGLLQETCSFYWQNSLMHRCPKRCQSHARFGKTNALDNILCFQTKFKAAHIQTQQYSFLFNPQNSSKNMHTSAPSLAQGISMRKGFNHKSLFRGVHTLTRPQGKAFQTICIINNSLSHASMCKLMP